MAASVRDVAEAAGVSVGTVSNVLNRPDKVSSATVGRVQDAIDRLGFVRNDAARQLRAGRSRTIGLVVLDLHNPFFSDVALGAEERAEQSGLSVLVANSAEKQAREAAHLDLFEEQRVLGVLVTPARDDIRRLRRMREHGIPAVLVDRQSQDPSFASVAVDDVEGGRLAAEHLLQLGRRRLMFVGGPISLRQVSDRLEGAQRAVADVPGATLEFVGTQALTVEDGRRAAERIAARDAATRPDAVFAANDLIALGVLQGLLQSREIRVPDDVALIGYDDIDFASAAVVPLSSIRQPAHLIGSTAVELLLALEADPEAPREHVVYRPELVVRASTSG
jgi:LacI family transcriptional regulator